jgi:hypothetical protein
MELPKARTKRAKGVLSFLKPVPEGKALSRLHQFERERGDFLMKPSSFFKFCKVLLPATRILVHSGFNFFDKIGHSERSLG